MFSLDTNGEEVLPKMPVAWGGLDPSFCQRWLQRDSWCLEMLAECALINRAWIEFLSWVWSVTLDRFGWVWTLVLSNILLFIEVGAARTIRIFAYPGAVGCGAAYTCLEGEGGMCCTF